MDGREFLTARKWLKDYGYLPNVSYASLDALDRKSVELRQGAEMAQKFYGTKFIGEPDAVIGPRTLSVMAEPRCGFPDTNYDKELLPNAAGSGSWPAACHETGIRVSIDTRNAPSWMDVDAIFEISKREYAKVGCLLVRVPYGESAHIRQSFRSLSGSTIGLAEFNNQSCSDSVFNYRDPSYNGGAERNVNLDLHELGHNNNLEHRSQGGIMHPSITSSPNMFVDFGPNMNIIYQDPSYQDLKKRYGGLPIPTIPIPPVPPVPPTPIPLPPEPPRPPMPPIDWREILAFVLEMISLCRAQGMKEQRIRENIRNPGPVQKFRLENRVRTANSIRIREWRRVADEVMAPYYESAKELTDDDLDRMFAAAAEDE